MRAARILATAEREPAPAPDTWRAVAKACGISVRVLNSYRHERGFPATKDPAILRDWIAKRRVLGTVEGLPDAPEIMQRRKAADMLAAEQKARILELEHRTLKGDLVARAEIEAEYGQMVAAARSRLEQIPGRMRLRLAGLLDLEAAEELIAWTVAEIRTAILGNDRAGSE